MSDTVLANTPPADHGGRTTHAHHARTLRANPRQWGLIATYPSRTAAQRMASKIRSGHRVAYTPSGEFEAVAITDEKQTHQVWARFVGGER